MLEILTGKGDHFPGLIPLIFAYLEASHSSARFLAISWPSLGPLSAVSLHLSATSRPSLGHPSAISRPRDADLRPSLLLAHTHRQSSATQRLSSSCAATWTSSGAAAPRSRWLPGSGPPS